MFHLETTNIRFEHLDICSKGYWGQRSPKVIKGHLRSLSVKNKIIAIPHILKIIAKPEACYVTTLSREIF